MVLYSDGILEAANEADEQFGEDRVAEVVRAHRDQPAEEIRNQILSAVARFTGNAAAADDQTLLVIRKSAA
jgi:sigma-B regulation protein RsbU (phosphoserine phosphatase)